MVEHVQKLRDGLISGIFELEDISFGYYQIKLIKFWG